MVDLQPGDDVHVLALVGDVFDREFEVIIPNGGASRLRMFVPADMVTALDRNAVIERAALARRLDPVRQRAVRG